MILVDTFVWIDHFRSGSAELEKRLGEQTVLMHPFVRGELACGNLNNRAEIIGYLGRLSYAVLAQEEEVLKFIADHKLAGRGIGYIDMHLLASCFLTGGATLWTMDTRLATAAATLGVA